MKSTFANLFPERNQFMKTGIETIEIIEATVAMENIDATLPQAGTEGPRQTTPKDSRLRPWLLAFVVILFAWFVYAALSMAGDILSIVQAIGPNW